MREYLNHLFFPRESNNHRAKLLHHISLLYLALFFFLAGLVAPTLKTEYPNILGVNTSISIDRLLTLTNEQRQQRGQLPLTLNETLSTAAMKKGEDMFAKNYWAHFAPDGGTPWGFIRGAGYEYLYAGENLARGFSSPEDVVSAWMNSEGHKDNILSPNYTDIGFAVLDGKLTGDETILIVQVFGSKAVSKSVTPEKVALAPQTTVAPPATIAGSLITPSATPTPTLSPIKEAGSSGIAIAGFESSPLVNTKATGKNISLIILLVFIFILVVDMIIIARKKIVRVISHSLDHFIFLLFIIVVIFLITRGAIL